MFIFIINLSNLFYFYFLLFIILIACFIIYIYLFILFFFFNVCSFLMFIFEGHIHSLGHSFITRYCIYRLTYFLMVFLMWALKNK